MSQAEGGKLTKKCGFDRSWRNPAWLSLLRVKPTEWGKCISGRGCLDTGGRGGWGGGGDEREREVLGKGWIQRLGHNEAHQAGWALRAVTCIGSSPLPNTSQCTAKPVSWTWLQNSFTVSIADPRKCRSGKKEKVTKRGEKRIRDVEEWWRLTYQKYYYHDFQRWILFQHYNWLLSVAQYIFNFNCNPCDNFGYFGYYCNRHHK